MSFITPYLQQVVIHERAGALNVYGQPTFTSSSIPARVQQRMSTVRTSEGKEVVSDATVFLEPDVVISPGDRFLFEGAGYQVLAVARGQGLTAATHQVAYLGRG